jgi:hypothetical protein
MNERTEALAKQAAEYAIEFAVKDQELYIPRLMEKFAELIVKDIVDDLGTLRWSGYDKGWDLAIETVRKDLIKRIEE